MNKTMDASNRLTFEFNDIEAQSYLNITSSIAKKFKLEPSNELVRGLDEIFQDYKIGQNVVGLEWDNWSGYIVTAKNQESENLAKEIARFISENYATNT